MHKALHYCLLWLLAVRMVVKLLDVSVWAYLATFALPVAATLLMWGCGWLVQQELAEAETVVRLGATIGAGAVSYGALIMLLGRGRIGPLLRFLRRRS